MARNFPGPFSVEIRYSVTATPGGAIIHRQNLNVNVISEPSAGTPFSGITVLQADGSNIDLETIVDQWVALLRPHLSAGAATIVDATLWENVPLSLERSFISTYSIALVGTNGSAPAIASQQIYTLRTAEGGVMKIYIQESSFGAGGIFTYPTGNAAVDDVFDWLVDNQLNAWLARDTSYPISPIRWLPGGSEATFKQRYRP